MPTNTTNFSLKKPIVGADEDLWGGYINDNLDDLDSLLGDGAPLKVDTVNSKVLIGHDTSQSIRSEMPLQVVGVSAGSAGIGIIRHQASGGGPSLRFAKTRATSKGDVTVVEDGDVLGDLSFYGADGTDLFSMGAQIQAQVDGTAGLNDMPARLVFSTSSDGNQDPTERMRIDSSGKVGIGTASPTNIKGNSTLVDVSSPSGTVEHILRGSSAVLSSWAGANAANTGTTTNHPLKFYTDNTERMQLTDSGTLLVGKTSSSTNSAGAEFRSDGASIFVRSGSVPVVVNRKSNDGDCIQFRQDNVNVGKIGTASDGDFFIASAVSGGCGLQFQTANVLPATNTGASIDNSKDLGGSSFRWDDVYATNGTIQTSDEREKQDIRDITEAEARVAQACKGLLKAYRWKDAVAEKGDDARIHFGIIAQDLQAAFAAEGLDAGDYAMFIHTTWWESTEVIPAVEAVEAQDAVYEDVVIPAVLDDEGNEIEPERTEQRLVSEAFEAVEAQPERTVTHTHETQEEAPAGAVQRDRMGVRYPELLAFIIAAM
jgi:hypothetical protein